MTADPSDVDAESVSLFIARCPVCHDVDLYTDEASMRLRCVNCGSDVSGADLATPAVSHDEKCCRFRIFPVLQWAWAPCQTCGSDLDLIEDDPHDVERTWCPDCRGPRTRQLELDRLDGRDEVVKVTDFEAPLQLGNPCVSDVMSDVQLVGMGPFHAMQVIGVWGSGHLDVVETDGGRRYVGVPAHAILPTG